MSLLLHVFEIIVCGRNSLDYSNCFDPGAQFMGLCDAYCLILKFLPDNGICLFTFSINNCNLGWQHIFLNITAVKAISAPVKIPKK